jgi:hypothetical protein
MSVVDYQARAQTSNQANVGLLTAFLKLWRMSRIKYTSSQSVVPLSLIFMESGTYRVANFGVQQQLCGVSGLQPLQVLESVAERLEI